MLNQRGNLSGLQQACNCQPDSLTHLPVSSFRTNQTVTHDAVPCKHGLQIKLMRRCLSLARCAVKLVADVLAIPVVALGLSHPMELDDIALIHSHAPCYDTIAISLQEKTVRLFNIYGGCNGAQIKNGDCNGALFCVY
jgi:hypothetical protein